MENINSKEIEVNKTQNTKKVINWALSQKGEGSIKRVWERYKKAKADGDESLAASLAKIARGKFAYANKMKKNDSSFFGSIKKALNETLGI